MVQLNTLVPANGSKTPRKRVGRGGGSGLGKTSGRGHKGQKARAGGFHKVGFEGGQMPLQRRLPKFGFSSRVSRFVVEVRLHELAKVKDGVITVDSLRQAGVIGAHAKRVRIMASGEISTAVKISGIHVTKGARVAIAAAGGTIED
jgi:large subunit ribosomal protein L15